VSLISARTSQVTSTVTIGNGPGGAAADSLTATAYVTNFTDGTVSVITN
jgi:DNA-binding beta-propeller fold protein YncE